MAAERGADWRLFLLTFVRFKLICVRRAKQQACEKFLANPRAQHILLSFDDFLIIHSNSLCLPLNVIRIVQSVEKMLETTSRERKKGMKRKKRKERRTRLIIQIFFHTLPNNADTALLRLVLKWLWQWNTQPARQFSPPRKHEEKFFTRSLDFISRHKVGTCRTRKFEASTLVVIVLILSLRSPLFAVLIRKNFKFLPFPSLKRLFDVICMQQRFIYSSNAISEVNIIICCRESRSLISRRCNNGEFWGGVWATKKTRKKRKKNEENKFT